jgi:hypothetical protein
MTIFRDALSRFRLSNRDEKLGRRKAKPQDSEVPPDQVAAGFFAARRGMRSAPIWGSTPTRKDSH